MNNTYATYRQSKSLKILAVKNVRDRNSIGFFQCGLVNAVIVSEKSKE